MPLIASLIRHVIRRFKAAAADRARAAAAMDSLKESQSHVQASMSQPSTPSSSGSSSATVVVEKAIEARSPKGEPSVDFTGEWAISL